MKATRPAFRFSAGIPVRRGVAWAGALVLMQMLAGTVAADSVPSGVSLRGEAAPDGGVYVEWAREAGPPWLLGWHVERQLPDGGVLRVTSGRVEVGLFDPPAFAYRFHDATVQAREGDALTYRLVMVDPELREWPSAFVPIRVGPVAEAFPPAAPEPLRMKAAPVRRDAPPSTVGARVRIAVTNDGLVRLTAGEIAAVLEGLAEPQVAQWIAQTNLALTCGGESVAWRAEAGGGALLFFGQDYRDTYADQNVYWLDPGPGLAMGFSSRATGLVAADPWFWETARAESNLHFMTYVPGGLDDDYWIWDFRQLISPASSGQWTTSVELTDAHPGVKEGAVTAHLVSYNDGPAAFDNHTQLSAAGQLLDDRLWAGDVRLSQSGVATNLGGASVSVTVGLLREADVTTTTVLIDAIDVRYARRMRARNNQLLFRAEAGTNVLTVRGFSSPSIQVFDVADPLRPVEIAATVAQEGAEWRVSWSANPAEPGRFLAAAAGASPARIDGVSDAGWGRPMAGAPHLVIAPRALTNAAAALVAHRRQQGLDSLLVPIEEVYDDFAFGRRDSRAIPRFLAYAQARWTVPPAYVCLAGDGHLDYHDYYGQALTRPNHVPPLLDRIPYATPAGSTVRTIGLDNPLADTDGDGIPDLAIGRLPAQTPAALAAMINRIVACEASDVWKSRVLLVSDKDEDDAFGAARERLATHVPPGMSVQRLGHTMSTPAETMRANFIQAMNSGSVLAAYYGHANNIGISSPHFFEHSYLWSDMPALVNGTNAPLLLAGTCMLNDFAPPHPSSRCLGKGFLDTAPGGAVAVWASAAEATLSMAEATTGAIFDELFRDHDTHLGDMIWAALDLQSVSASPWTVRSSVLLGDPGMRVRTHLGLDQTPPNVRITSPSAGATYVAATNRILLAGTATDFGGIDRVWIRNHRDIVEFLPAGTEHWQIEGFPLHQGLNLIDVIALDAAGNRATQTLSVTYSGDAYYEAGLRSGQVVQAIDFPDPVQAGHTVRIRWRILSYVPVRSYLQTMHRVGNQTIWTVRRNGAFLGEEESPWNIGGGAKRARVYSFECDWTAPDSGEAPVDIYAWFNVAQTDGQRFLMANIPDGVDGRPDPSIAKVFRRTVLPNAGPGSPDVAGDEEPIRESSVARQFDALEDIRKRSGGVVTHIAIPDHWSPGSSIVCEWKVLAYMDIEGQLAVADFARSTIPVQISAVRTAATPTSFNFTHNGQTHYATEYSFQATMTVPAEWADNPPGEAGRPRVQVFFRHRVRATSGSRMACNLASGVDARPFETDGMFGRFIERTIAVEGGP